MSPFRRSRRSASFAVAVAATTRAKTHLSLRAPFPPDARRVPRVPRPRARNSPRATEAIAREASTAMPRDESATREPTKRETSSDERGSPRARRRDGSPFAETADPAFALGAAAPRPDASTRSTTFLVGAYSKYQRPYAWIRSGLSDRDDAAEQDSPLDLECTQNWEEGHRAWDVVEELVRMRVFPAPANAFEVDHHELGRVPRDDRYLLTGALVAFLRDVAADEGAAAARRRGESGGAFEAAVTHDLEKLVRRHFADVPERLRRA